MDFNCCIFLCDCVFVSIYIFILYVNVYFILNMVKYLVKVFGLFYIILLCEFYRGLVFFLVFLDRIDIIDFDDNVIFLK